MTVVVRGEFMEVQRRMEYEMRQPTTRRWEGFIYNPPIQPFSHIHPHLGTQDTGEGEVAEEDTAGPVGEGGEELQGCGVWDGIEGGV